MSSHSAMAAPGTADADAGKAEETSPQTLVCKSAALGDLDTIKKTLEQHPGDLINDVDEQVPCGSPSPCHLLVSSDSEHV